MNRVKVIDLGIRENMSASQILSEAAKWNWNSYVLVGWVNDDSEPDIELDESSTFPPSRFTTIYHPKTSLEEAIVLSHLVIDEAIQDMKENAHER